MSEVAASAAEMSLVLEFIASKVADRGPRVVAIRGAVSVELATFDIVLWNND